jgi:hypothetical protein
MVPGLGELIQCRSHAGRLSISEDSLSVCTSCAAVGGVMDTCVGHHVQFEHGIEANFVYSGRMQINY